MTMTEFVRTFESLTLRDIPLVGGKNASLGELTQSLKSKGLRVPEGFAVTSDAYTELLRANRIESEVRKLARGFKKDNLADFRARAKKIRNLILKAGIPKSVAEEIQAAYRTLIEGWGGRNDVAVRSSATAEDLPNASFAGQQESFLNIRGESELLTACLQCYASLFTDRAIAYRIDNGFEQMDVKLSIGVQRMVRSDLASAGVIFTLDPESGFRNVVLISASYGLGESVVAGKVDPDEFIVFKPTLDSASRPILRMTCGAKQTQIVYAKHGKESTRSIPVSRKQSGQFCLTEAEVLQLARAACQIEKHYTDRSGKDTPMDIEWAKDGESGILYIVQARPETVHSQKPSTSLVSFRLNETGSVLVQGQSIGDRIGSGKVRIITSPKKLSSFMKGEVLVTEMTDPDWEPIMKSASAIVTNKGGRTCHAAIVSRELGIPCVVGAHNATEVLTNGKPVTVSCAEGSTGKVYEGTLKFSSEKIKLKNISQLHTKLMLNVASPESAFALGQLPVAGVGLARQEFIISNQVKIHPLALTRFDQIESKATRDLIERLTRGYATKDLYYVHKLAQGIGTIAGAFFPRDVIVRLSDFKTNEYANLIGGRQFEFDEQNPMIGFRGASRYYSPHFKDGFSLECRALQMVRQEMGLNNIKIMIPFCRTLEEADLVIGEMASHGLIQHKDGLEFYMMCEVPANVLLMDKFAQIFDGFSIGSNDLTQLVLGIDRDSEVLTQLFDERNEAVFRAIEQAINGAHFGRRKIGICGEAPSDFPEVVEFLIAKGIDSISLNEDALAKTIQLVARIERKAERAVA